MRISLDKAITKTVDHNEFLNIFLNFNITATEQDIDEFLAIDNESSHVFQEEIIDEANCLFVKTTKLSSK